MSAVAFPFDTPARKAQSSRVLVIIVPLRSRSTARDWSQVSRLCERSLRSYCRGGAEHVRVVLVCQEPPEMNFTHPALTIISETFPDPGPLRDDRERDKWRKLKRGLVAVRDLLPAHIMFADADDLIHESLAATVAAAPECPGWYLPLGYFYEEPSRWVYRWPDFDQYCGTSAMIRCTADDVPATVDEPNERFFILMQGHLVIRQFMQERGTPLRAIPYPAAIYNTGTGENLTGIFLRNWGGKKMFVKKLLRTRPVTPSLREAFGLHPLEPKSA